MFIDNIDLVLFGALVVDLVIKQYKLNKIKKQMRKWKRYQSNTTKLKYIIYGIILALSVIYIIFRIYSIAIHGNEFVWPKFMIIIPLIDYYVLWDWFIAGIYYNGVGIYYKSEYYEYRRAVHIYRDLVKDKYEYEITYREPKSGERTFVMRVPNEKEAFPLLATIPFEEWKAPY